MSNHNNHTAGKVEGAYDEEMEYGAGLSQSLQRFESRDKRMKTANLEERAKRQARVCVRESVCARVLVWVSVSISKDKSARRRAVGQ